MKTGEQPVLPVECKHFVERTIGRARVRGLLPPELHLRDAPPQFFLLDFLGIACIGGGVKIHGRIVCGILFSEYKPLPMHLICIVCFF